MFFFQDTLFFTSMQFVTTPRGHVFESTRGDNTFSVNTFSNPCLAIKRSLRTHVHYLENHIHSRGLGDHIHARGLAECVKRLLAWRNA